MCDTVAHLSPQVLGAHCEGVFTSIVALGAEGYYSLSGIDFYYPVSDYHRVVVDLPDHGWNVINNNVTHLDVRGRYLFNQDQVAWLILRLHTGAEDSHKRHYSSD